MKTVWTNTLAWAGAAAAALALAVAAPSESTVMGKLPSLTAKRLDQRTLLLPAGLPSDRTLALVAFEKGHRNDIDSWIQGLQLHQNPGINWLRMPVLEDPGHAQGRSAIENRLLARYTSDGDRARMLPVFTDRAAFIRATGLNSPHAAYALVLNRNGDVLARVEGQFDQDKAEALRETLFSREF
ncbi:MAG: hypothetical protein KIS62_15875 [Ramlibacter sp.]|nr:hypothetical protein [Ramlibacter sp.]